MSNDVCFCLFLNRVVKLVKSKILHVSILTNLLSSPVATIVRQNRNYVAKITPVP